ncbi:MAG: hypothetical protein Q9164_001357 [Protoblastenia rupestris]
MPSLEKYVARVYDDKYSRSCSSPKEHRFRATKALPLLQKGRVNRVLVYHGSFNPPHRGHLELLRHGYLHSGDGLNLIAAIVKPKSDDYVRKKYTSEDETLVYTREQRTKLWKQDLRFPGWAWVYDGRDGTFSTFRQELQRLASVDGYKLEFVTLGGPDTITPSESPENVTSASTYIVSDIARIAKFDGSKGLQRFNNFGEWTTLSVNTPLGCYNLPEAIEQTAPGICFMCPKMEKEVLCGGAPFHDIHRLKMLSVSTDLDYMTHPENNVGKIGESPMKVDNHACRVEVCHHVRNKHRTIRFIRSSNAQHRQVRGISSTKLRDAIHSLQGDELKKSLRKVALSPDLLWELSTGNSKKRKRDEEGGGEIFPLANLHAQNPTTTPTSKKLKTKEPPNMIE